MDSPAGRGANCLPASERWLAGLRRAWEPWGVLILTGLGTAFLLRGWLAHALPSTPRQETFAELHITATMLDDLRRGRILELWNPREFTGYPWLQFIPWPIYLVLAAVAYLGGIPLTGVMVAFYLLMYLGSGLTMYAYVRRLTPSRSVATLAAALYLWYPPHAHLGAETWAHAAFWGLFPLALYLVERMVAAPRGAGRHLWSLLLGALLAAFAVCTIEYTMFAAPFIVIYVLVREAALVRARRETVWGSLARLAVVGAIALSLSAFVVWPALTAIATVGIHNKHAGGSTFTNDLLRGYALTPSLVLYAIGKRTHLPIPYGKLPAAFSAFYSVTWYPGLIASALVALGLAAVWRERRLGLQVVLWALGLLMAVGPNLPGNPISALPALGRLTPFRAILFVVVFASVLAGFGGELILRRLASPAGRALVVGLLVALMVGDFASSSAAFIGVERYFSPAEEAAQAWLRERRGDGGYRLWEPKALPRDEYRAILDVTRIGMPRFWGYFDNGAPLYTWQLYNWGDLATNLRLSGVRFSLLDGRVAADAAVRQVLARAGYRPVNWGIEGLTLYEDPQPLPYARAYPVAALSIEVRPEDALPTLPALYERHVALVSGGSPYIEDYDTAATDPYTYVLAEGAAERWAGSHQTWLERNAAKAQAAGALAQLPAAPVVGSEQVRWRRPAPGEIRVDVDLPQRAVVTVAEAWYPHWQVTVDGRPAALLRVNYAFQGAWVSAGAHQVVFRYCVPWLDRLGWDVSLAGAVALLAALAVVGGRYRCCRRRIKGE